MAKRINETILGGILMACIPLLLFSISIAIVQHNHQPEIVEHQSVLRAGYESAPQSYSVSASPHKKWADYADHHLLLIILGYVVAVIGTVAYAWWIEYKALSGSIWVAAMLWVGGACLIFVGYVVKTESVRYEKLLDVSEYEANKTNLDALFPIK